MALAAGPKAGSPSGAVVIQKKVCAHIIYICIENLTIPSRGKDPVAFFWLENDSLRRQCAAGLKAMDFSFLPPPLSFDRANLFGVPKQLPVPIAPSLDDPHNIYAPEDLCGAPCPLLSELRPPESEQPANPNFYYSLSPIWHLEATNEYQRAWVYHTSHDCALSIETDRQLHTMPHPTLKILAVFVWSLMYHALLILMATARNASRSLGYIRRKVSLSTTTTI